MNKREQRLSELTKALSAARHANDQDQIEKLEDEIAELEYEMEQEINRRFGDFDDTF